MKFPREMDGVCIPAKEVNGVLSDLHEGEPVRHPGGRKLWQMILH